MLRSAAAADVQTIAAALIAVINSLPGGGPSAYNSTWRCRMCNQPSMPAWINTRSGIRMQSNSSTTQSGCRSCACRPTALSLFAPDMLDWLALQGVPDRIDCVL